MATSHDSIADVVVRAGWVVDYVQVRRHVCLLCSCMLGGGGVNAIGHSAQWDNSAVRARREWCKVTSRGQSQVDKVRYIEACGLVSLQS
jgi:hypothetical protein